jgi:site-specific recombinase XerD
VSVRSNPAVVKVLRHTGLRVGELCSLRLSDIRTSERKGSVLVRSGKGDKDRTIPLNHDVREAVEAYLKVRPAAAHDHLFLGQRGEPLQTDGVQLIVRKLARRAGLELEGATIGAPQREPAGTGPQAHHRHS